MFCKRCGNPLPSEGAVCKFCNTAMSQEQVTAMQQEKKNQEFRPELKTEMYGQSKIEYREDNKSGGNPLLGALIIGGIVLFIIILAIILNS